MRHLSAVPLLSTAMIAVLMLSMSILIACAGNSSDPGPATNNTGSPAPPEPISQPEAPTDTHTAARAAEIPADSPQESETMPDLSGETPGTTRMEESPPAISTMGKPVEPASLAPPAKPMKEMKSDADSLKAKAKDFFGTFVGGHVEGTFVGGRADRDDKSPPATGMHGGPPLDTGKHGGRPMQPQPDLKAGEVDDNQRWSEYLQFTKDYEGPPVHRTNLADRRIITVLDRDGNPVPNAIVTVSDNGKKLTEYLTYADGRTLIFPEALTTGESGQLSINVERDGFTKNTSIFPEKTRPTPSRWTER